MTTSVLTVLLSARNNFGSTQQLTQTITLTSSPILIINFDPTIPKVISRSISYSLSIGSITACSISNSITVTWSITSLTNNITAVDENTLWASQTSKLVLTIPPRTLPANSFVTFNAHAKDDNFFYEGSASLSLQVGTSDPIIVFSRSDGLAGISQELAVDPGKSYDPDNISTLSYLWGCVSSTNTNCNSLIQNTALQIMTVPPNRLVRDITYTFTLTLTKTTKNPVSLRMSVTKSIQITAQAAVVPTVNIVEIGNTKPGIVNPDSTYRVSATGTITSIL